MRYSFDFGGTVREQPLFAAFIAKLQGHGHSCTMLTGCSTEAERDERRKWVTDHNLVLPINFTKPDRSGGEEEKAEFCSLMGVDVHFDDSWRVRKAINKISPGTICILVSPKTPKKW